MGKGEEKKLRDLLIKATRDMEFREEFLRKPVDIGKKYGVSFTAEQIEKIKNTSMFIESLKDIIVMPPPPVYPMYPILVRWKIDEISRTLEFFDPRIFYPRPFYRRIWTDRPIR